MKPPAPPSRSLRDLRDLTPARVGLGRAGASLPTEALLEFTLDHARARDAVHAAFDVAALVVRARRSRPATRSRSPAGRATGSDYLRRPDLGRMLDPALDATAGEPCRQPVPACDRHRRWPVADGGQRPRDRTRPQPRSAIGRRSASRSAQPWSRRARASRWATRSAPFSVRA